MAKQMALLVSSSSSWVEVVPAILVSRKKISNSPSLETIFEEDCSDEHDVDDAHQPTSCSGNF
nr:hypothetical protein JCGZ_16500 [Ipomoea trifida]